MSNVRNYVATHLGLADKFFNSVYSGKKTSTIRYGFVFFTKVTIVLRSSVRSATVRITKLDYSKTLRDLDEEDAKRDGFQSLEELKSELRHFYGNVPSDYPMTIVHFKLETSNADQSIL